MIFFVLFLKTFILFHSLAHEVPGWHLLQRASYWLDVPEQEDDEHGDGDDASDAVELLDTNHQKLGGIVR